MGTIMGQRKSPCRCSYIAPSAPANAARAPVRPKRRARPARPSSTASHRRCVVTAVLASPPHPPRKDDAACYPVPPSVGRGPCVAPSSALVSRDRHQRGVNAMPCCRRYYQQLRAAAAQPGLAPVLHLHASAVIQRTSLRRGLFVAPA